MGAFDGQLTSLIWAVLDVETTGFVPGHAALIELAVVLSTRRRYLGVYSTLISPDRHVPSVISGLTGITDSMLIGAPSAADVLPIMFGVIRLGVAAGHHPVFDWQHLQQVKSAGLSLSTPVCVVDTLKLARKLVAPVPANYRLGTLSAHLGLRHQPNHRALPDALTTTDLLYYLIDIAQTRGVSDLQGLLRIQSGHLGV